MKKLEGIYRYGIREAGTTAIVFRSATEDQGREMLPRFARKRGDVELVDRDGQVIASMSAAEGQAWAEEREAQTKRGKVVGWL